MKVPQDNKKGKQLRVKVAKWFELNKAHNEESKRLKKMKEEISKDIESFMDSKGTGIAEFDYVDETEGGAMIDSVIRAVRVLSKKVNFDADKLEKKLGKERCKKFIRRTYEINDWKGFSKLMKSKGVKLDEVIQFINLKKEVDNDALDELEKQGFISYDDVKGCFTISDTKSFLRFTIVTKKKENDFDKGK